MASWFSDRLCLGSVRNSNVVNSKAIRCEDYFSNSKIPKQEVEMVGLILMLLYQ